MRKNTITALNQIQNEENNNFIQKAQFKTFEQKRKLYIYS